MLLAYVRRSTAAFAVCALLAPAPQLPARRLPSATQVAGRVLLPSTALKSRQPSIVVWLSSASGPSVEPPAPGRFRLVQKNRMFTPHLLVIPVGSVVSFPNQDPFFHNVFSLFNGKRFDLGLYEAGSSREVQFSREGVSYIFCNIHPEMSAVVLALATPLYDVAAAQQKFSIQSVPAGTYDLHVWIEGMQQPALDRLTRRVTVSADRPEFLTVDATAAYHPPSQHLNLFGKPYARETSPPY